MEKPKRIFNKVGTLAIFIGLLTSVQGAFNSGCLVTTLSSIQRRFRLTTFESSVILASFDVGVLAMAIPTELITRNMRRRGLLLGMSSLVMSLAIFFFAFPHFVITSIGEDIQGHLTNISLFCKLDIDPVPRTNQMSDWMYLFTAVTFLCGASLLPIWTTGYAIIEKETDERSGTRNIAFVNIFGSMLGPVLGLTIGSISISFWEQPSLTSDINLTPDDPNWIGAWWIPFMTIGSLGLLAAVPVFCFPDQFPGTEAIIIEREKERLNLASKADGNNGFISDLKVIFTNRTWLFGCLGLIADNFFLSAALSYINKFQESAFYISGSLAGIGSAFMIVGGVVGAVVALVLTQRLDWKISTCKFSQY